MRLVNVLEETNDYFKPRKDCCRQLSFSPLGKCMASGYLLIVKPQMPLMLKSGWKTSHALSTVKFACTVMKVFGPELPREQILGDTNFFWQFKHEQVSHVSSAQLIAYIANRKTGPKGFRGHYQSNTKNTTIIIEAVTSKDL